MEYVCIGVLAIIIAAWGFVSHCQTTEEIDEYKRSCAFLDTHYDYEEEKDA